MYYVEFTSKLVLTHLLKSRLLQLALLSLALRHRKHISPQHCYKNISEDYLAEDLTNNMLSNMQEFLLMHVNISS